MKKRISLLLLASIMGLFAACGGAEKTGNEVETGKVESQKSVSASFDVKNNSGGDITAIYVYECAQDSSADSTNDEKIVGKNILEETIPDGETKTVKYDLIGDAEEYKVKFIYEREDIANSATWKQREELEKGGTWDLTSYINYAFGFTPNENENTSEQEFEIKNESEGDLVELYISSNENILEMTDTLDNILEGEPVKSGESRNVTYEYDSGNDNYYIGWNIQGEDGGKFCREISATELKAGGTIEILQNLVANMTFVVNEEVESQKSESVSFDIKNNSGTEITSLHVYGLPEGDPAPPKGEEILKGETIADGETKTITCDLLGDEETYVVEINEAKGIFSSCVTPEREALEEGNVLEITFEPEISLEFIANEDVNNSDVSYEVKNLSDTGIKEVYIGCDNGSTPNLVGNVPLKSNETREIEYKCDSETEEYEFGVVLDGYDDGGMHVEYVQQSDMHAGGELVITGEKSIDYRFRDRSEVMVEETEEKVVVEKYYAPTLSEEIKDEVLSTYQNFMDEKGCTRCLIFGMDSTETPLLMALTDDAKKVVALYSDGAVTSCESYNLSINHDGRTITNQGDNENGEFQMDYYEVLDEKIVLLGSDVYEEEGIKTYDSNGNEIGSIWDVKKDYGNVRSKYDSKSFALDTPDSWFDYVDDAYEHRNELLMDAEY